MIKEKNIAVCVILSIVTFGIYGLIWFCKINSDVRNYSNNSKISGGKAIFFTILTFGIYYIYWNYKIGKVMYEAKLKNGIQSTDYSVAYLILTIIGLGIVNYCLIQNELNKIATV